MKNHFTLLDEILYKGLRPWLNTNNPDAKFASMISDIKDAVPASQPKYKIQFERPFNNKTKYYSKLISNEAIRTINILLDVLNEDDNPQLIKYRLNDTLNKKLKTKLLDIGKIIKDQQFDADFINPRKTTFDIDQQHKTNTFIFQLLKTTLIHMYLEIQSAFTPWIQDEFVIEDFYSQLLYEQVPVQTYINLVETLEVAPVVNNSELITDAQEISLQSFTYIDYHKNSEKLTWLCDSLKNSGFIHHNTTTVNFKKVFSGKEINIPVVWTGNQSEFSYFIKLVHNIHNLVINLKQDQWKVALQCFIKEDGTSFKNSVRKLDRPAKTGDKLDKAVSLLL